MELETGSERSIGVVSARMCGKSDRGGAASFFLRQTADRSHQCQSIHPGHTDVRDDDVRMAAPQFLDRFECAREAGDARPPIGKNLAQEQSRILVVVDYQYLEVVEADIQIRPCALSLL